MFLPSNHHCPAPPHTHSHSHTHSTWGTRICDQAQLLHEFQSCKLRSSCVHSKHFYLLSHLFSPPQKSWCLDLEAQTLLPSFWVRHLVCSLNRIIFYAIIQYKDLEMPLRYSQSSIPFLPMPNPCLTTNKKAATFGPSPLNFL